MRVAIDARPLQSPSRLRGIGTYTRSLIQNSLDSGKDIVLIIWDMPGQIMPSYAQQTFALPAPTHRHLGWFYDRYMHKNYFRRLAQSVDLMHFTSPFELDLSWPGFDLGVPRIVTCHDLMPVTHAQTILQGKQRLLKGLYSKQADWLSSADGVICDSQATADVLKATVRKVHDVKVALLGVPHSVFKPSPRAVEYYRTKKALPEKFILFFSGLSRNKNLETLLEAIEGRDFPPLVIAGNAREEDKAYFQSKYNTDKIIWLGRVSQPDVPALYASATLFVMPSLVEGFGLPIVEAMCCGAPVACSDIPPFREIADGAAAFFNPQRVEEVSGTIQRLLDNADERETLRCKAEEIAASLKFEKTTEKTWEYYSEFIENYQCTRH